MDVQSLKCNETLKTVQLIDYVSVKCEAWK